MKKIVVVLIFILILIGCEAKKQPSFDNDFPSMQDVDHVYQKTTYTKALNLILDNTGVLVLGYNEENPLNNRNTAEIIPLLNQVAIEVGYEEIYYLDVYDMKANNTTEYRLLLAYIDFTVGDLHLQNNSKQIVTPDVYFIKDGKIVGHHIGTIENENGAFIQNLTIDQEAELKDIYRDLFTRLMAE